MANELTTTTDRPVPTPLGAQALRSIECSAIWSEADAAEIRRWLTPAVRGALPAAIAQATALLTPATRGDARRTLMPTLSLVAPVGMTEDDQTAWIGAALGTLSGIPADLLERGCLAARKVADHPSKIVAAIFKEIGAAWDTRKRDLSKVSRIADIAGGVDDTKPWEKRETFDPADAPTPEDIAAIKAEFGLTTDPYGEGVRKAASGPLREPTPEEAAEMAAEFKRDHGQLARLPDDDFPPPNIVGLTVREIIAQGEKWKADRAAWIANRDAERRAARDQGEGFADEMDDVDRYMAG